MSSKRFDGEVVEFIAGLPIAVGDVALIGTSMAVVAADDYGIGDTAQGYRTGVHEVRLKSGDTPTDGTPLHLDGVSGQVTTTAGGGFAGWYDPRTTRAAIDSGTCLLILAGGIHP